MPTDFLYDDDGDIAFANGDFVIDESTAQHIEDIMMAAPGHYRQWPLIGGSLFTINKGSFTAERERALKVALQYDGLKVAKITFDPTTDKLEVDASY